MLGRPSRRISTLAAGVLAASILASASAPPGAATIDGRRDPGLLGTAVKGTGLLPNFSAPGTGLIRLQSGAFDPLATAPPDVALPLGVAQYWIVQARDQRFPDLRDAIARAGGLVAGYVHDDAYMVRASPEQYLQIARDPSVRWAGFYRHEWRIPVAAGGKPGLLDLAGSRVYRVHVFDDEPDMASVGRALRVIPGVEVLDDAGASIDVRATAGEVPVIAAIPAVEWVGLKPEAVALNANARWVIDTGVRDLLAASVSGRLTGAGQTAGVADTGVNYKPDSNGRAHIAFRDCAPSCKEADYTQATAGTGTSELLGVVRNVSGAPHRKMAAYFDLGATGPEPHDPTAHGSHVAGSVVSDAGALGTADGHDGIAPGARLVHQNVGSPSGGLVLPADDYQLWRQAYRPRSPSTVPTSDTVGADLVNYVPLEDARTHNNSYGLLVDVIDEGSAIDLDEFVWEHEDMVIVVSAGNGGPNPATIGSPSVAKNDISSAASSNGRQPMVSIDSLTNFSSHGPTGDGRLGPDLATPGEIVISAKGGTESDYHVAQGTSMSGPVLTGAATLVRQYFWDGYGPAAGKGFPGGAASPARGHNPSAALVRAALVNGATRMRGWYTGDDGSQRALDGQYPSAGQGFGLVNLDNSLYFDDSLGKDPLHNWYQDVYRSDPLAFPVTAAPATRLYQFDVAAGAPFDVTLAWTDAPDLLPSGTPARVNNLDLTVTGPTGQTYVGNNFTSRPPASASVGVAETPNQASAPADALNVTEKVRIAAPLAGTYTISVRAGAIATGPQGFALAASGLIAPVASVFTPGAPLQADVPGTPAIGDVAIEPVSSDLAKLTFSTSEPTVGSATVAVTDTPITFTDVYNTGATGYLGRPGGDPEASIGYSQRPVVGTRHEIYVAGLSPGRTYAVQVQATDLASASASATASVTTASNVFQPLARDMAQLDGGTPGAAQWGNGKQMYAGAFDMSTLLGAFMFRVPESFDPGSIIGASVELVTGHDWVSRYDLDPVFTLDLLKEPVEASWGTQSYSQIKDAAADVRVAPATTMREGTRRWAFTFSCADLAALKANLVPQGGERRAAFRFDSTPPGGNSIVSAEFGYNRRSRGLDLRPKLVLVTATAGTPPFVPCDLATPAPLISDVGIHAGVSANSVVVSWRTNIDSDSVVLFREKGATEFVQVGTPARTRIHQVEVRGLDPLRNYEFGVRSAACNGAVATADNAGAGWDFFGREPAQQDLGDPTVHAFYDFESGRDGWTTASIDTDPVSPNPNTAWVDGPPGHDSARGWHAKPYFDSTDALLTSPQVNASGPTASIEFSASYDTEPTFDFLHVEYSAAGADWQTAASIDGINASYPSFERRQVTFAHGGGPLRVRFRFSSDPLVSSPAHDGVSVDRISIVSYPRSPSSGSGVPKVGPAPPPPAGASGLNLTSVPLHTPTLPDLAAGTGLCGAVPIPPRTPSTVTQPFFFAEGTTLEGFREYLLLANPSDASATTRVVYQFDDATAVETRATVPAQSRLTIDVVGVVGPGKTGVSIAMPEPSPLVAERSVYFDRALPPGRVNGAHTALGARRAQTSFTFAEGSTLEGFQEYVTVQNPGSEDATVTLAYGLEGGGSDSTTLAVPRGQRRTVDVNAEIGPGVTGHSTVVSSDRPVIVERPMYFARAIDESGVVVNGGHVAFGSVPAPMWHFAEGTVLDGFATYLTIANPDRARSAPADVTYYFADGSTAIRSTTVEPGSRRTIRVFDKTDPAGVGREVPDSVSRGLSIRVATEAPGGVVAERAVYFHRDIAGLPQVNDGHVAPGSAGLARAWAFAEGSTLPGFLPFLTVSNPSSSPARVVITYTPDQGGKIERVLEAGPTSRLTVQVYGTTEKGGVGGEFTGFGALVESPIPVLVERPLYILRALPGVGEINGGTVVIGQPRA